MTMAVEIRTRRLPSECNAPYRGGEDVLVLRVPNREPLPGVAHDELETRDARGDREERDRAVRVLARRDLAPPLAEVEHGSAAAAPHVDVAQGVVVKVRSQLRDLGGVGWNGKGLPVGSELG